MSVLSTRALMKSKLPRFRLMARDTLAGLTSSCAAILRRDVSSHAPARTLTHSGSGVSQAAVALARALTDRPHP